MKVYAESSAILAWLLGESASESVQAILEEAELVCASDLTLLECDRNLIRYEDAQRLYPAVAAERRAILAEFSRNWNVLRLDEEVVQRARNRFPHEPIRSLDALHLASALVAARTGPGMAILSLDERVRRAGRALGFDVVPA